MLGSLDGALFRHGDVAYEEARHGAVWNGRKPERFPELIVQAASERDVVAAVKFAKANGMNVGIRSGGHSWAASFLRDRGLLLDLSRLDAFSIDAASSTANVQPAVKGTELNRALRPYGLFFPTGHCTTVGLGGFLLQGGFGWNSRLWGPACASVRAIEVVTAGGDVVHADEKQNADLFWVARGAGPGFFGVVTRFHLSLFPRPKVMMNSSYLYPIEVMDEVYRWAAEARPSLARTMEGLVFLRRDIFGYPGPGLMVMGPTLAGSRDEAIDALAKLETCPALPKAVHKEVNLVTEFDELLAGGDELFYPVGHRYAADNMWTDAPADALLAGMHRIVDTLPEARSHMMWILWGPPPAVPDMAFSMQADLYIALYSVWTDPSQDAERQAWVTDNMKSLEPLAKGIQFADENLAARSFRGLSDENFRRVEALRAKWDPDGLFHSFMRNPVA